MDYWEKKEEMIKHAKEHNAYVLENFGKEIEECTKNTEVISESDAERLLHAWTSRERPTYSTIRSTMTAQTVMDAITSLKKGTDGDAVVLNFASFKHPGGAYMAGSSAQEESLCHGSILYPILHNFDKTFYAENRKDVNLGLYYTRMLYTPNVTFFCGKDGKKLKHVDVITCAAPNAGTATKKWSIPDEVVRENMFFRIASICELIAQHGKKIAILGAFGCGVFQNDPELTGKQFADVLGKYPDIRSIHPIPDEKTRRPFGNGYTGQFMEIFKDAFEVNTDDEDVTVIDNTEPIELVKF